MRPAADNQRFAERTVRLSRLISLNAPDGIVAEDCWLVLKAYSGGYWPAVRWVLAKRWRALGESACFRVMVARHRLGWCGGDCAACEDNDLDALDHAEFAAEVESLLAASGSLHRGEPYPEVDIRGLGEFCREVEPGLSDKIGDRLSEYGEWQRRRPPTGP